MAKTKTPITELIAYMNENRYYMGSDLRAEFERFLALEKQMVQEAYVKGKNDVVFGVDLSGEEYFEENYTQGRD